MKKLAVLVVLFIASTMTSQKMEVVKGDFGFLKGQKEINVIMDYSNMTVMKEKKSNADYVADRTKELNDKVRGNGDAWAQKWNASREMIWNPKFMELVNVVLAKEKKDLSFKEGAKDAKYTLIVETVWLFTGFDVMVMKQPAKVTTNLKFVETANKSNVLLEISSENAPGDQYGNNFSNESRIGEGYAKTGKSLAKMILKKV